MRKEDEIAKSKLPLAGVENIISSDKFLLSLPRIDNVSPVTGGVAHKVFQITSGDNVRYYLKIRGSRFESIPEIACDPADIATEYKALMVLHQIAPDNFPQVLSFNETLHYLILSDAILDGEKMEDLFLKNKVTPSMLFNFGYTLSRIHASTASYRDPIRTNGDSEYYQTVLGHRFGYRRNPVLDDLVKKLSDLDEKQLILGDVSPKNIGVSDNGKKFILFDLETAHRGDTVFDYAYFLGHILIHSLTSAETALANIDSYNQGYGQHKFNDLLVKRLALGTILYRLRSLVPYQTQLNAKQTAIIEERVESLLPYALDQLSWSKIVEFVIYGQN